MHATKKGRKTSAEYSREYRAKKKAMKNAAVDKTKDSSPSIVYQYQRVTNHGNAMVLRTDVQPNNILHSTFLGSQIQSTNDGSTIMIHKYERITDTKDPNTEQTDEHQQDPPESAETNIDNMHKPKTPAERMREYRARKNLEAQANDDGSSDNVFTEITIDDDEDDTEDVGEYFGDTAADPWEIVFVDD